MCPLFGLTSKEREKSSSLSIAVPKMESAEQKSSMRSIPDFGNQARVNRMQICSSFPQSCPTGCACHICPKSTPTVQTKLKINEPGDKYEQEADRVADQVMRMEESQRLVGGIQRVCSSCKEDEEELQRQPLEEEDEEEIMLKTDREGAATNVSTGAAVDNLASLGESGQSLSEVDNSFFSQRFGYDLSRVRVHTGSTASKDSQSINAKAFTYKNHIVFGDEQYRPATNSGRRLIAHELTHVIQQSSSSPAGIQREAGQKGDCAGHEEDLISFAGFLADHYVRTSLKRSPANGSNHWCSKSKKGDCSVQYEGLDWVNVRLPPFTPRGTVMARLRGKAGPVCTYSYTCGGPNNDLIFTQKSCEYQK